MEYLLGIFLLNIFTENLEFIIKKKYLNGLTVVNKKLSTNPLFYHTV